jgi:hypothetical protein
MCQLGGSDGEKQNRLIVCEEELHSTCLLSEFSGLYNEDD